MIIALLVLLVFYHLLSTSVKSLVRLLLLYPDATIYHDYTLLLTMSDYTM